MAPILIAVKTLIASHQSMERNTATAGVVFINTIELNHLINLNVKRKLNKSDLKNIYAQMEVFMELKHSKSELLIFESSLK